MPVIISGMKAITRMASNFLCLAATWPVSVFLLPSEQESNKTHPALSSEIHHLGMYINPLKSPVFATSLYIVFWVCVCVSNCLCLNDKCCDNNSLLGK